MNHVTYVENRIKSSLEWKTFLYRNLSVQHNVFLFYAYYVGNILVSYLTHKFMYYFFLCIYSFRYGPHFETGNVTNITVQVGNTFYLHCRISLLQDKTVSCHVLVYLIQHNFITSEYFRFFIIIQGFLGT